MFNLRVGSRVSGWFDGEHWDRPAIERALDRCEPDRPARKRPLAPPAPDAAVDAFESRFGIFLPAEYRRFLTEVSAGGPGPGHGLFLFDRSDLDDAVSSSSWAMFASPSDCYRTPFEPTRLDPDVLETDPDAANRQVGGTWLLADHGCADYTCLVLSGPRAGQLWDVDGLTLSPMKDRFARWYSTWLDRYLLAQAEPTEVRIGWSEYVTTTSWTARAIHNAIRDRDPTHRFILVAGAHHQLFDIEQFERLPAATREDFVEVLEQVADDISERTDPHARAIEQIASPSAIVGQAVARLGSL